MIEKLRHHLSSHTKESIKEKRNSFKITNHKLYFFLNFRHKLFIILAILTLLFGTIGFIVSQDTNGVLDTINNSIALFAFAYPSDDNLWLDIAKFLAILTVALGANLLFLYNKVNSIIVHSIQKNPYTLLIGLGTQNRCYLEQIKDPSSTLIIEADPDNKDIEHFKQIGFGILVGRAENIIGTINLQTLKTCIISTGNDRRNIALAMQLTKNIDNNIVQSIHVRIDNRNLGILFKEAVIQGDKRKNTDIIPYSLYENMTKKLFTDHSILGLQSHIIQGHDSYHIILIGSSNLAIEIIYYLALLSNLPNQNHLTLHLVDSQAEKFYQNIKKLYPGITKLSHFSINPLSLEKDTLDFYTHTIWKTEKLTNIIIATDDEESNLDIAINLQNTTYLKKIVAGAFKTNVLFAIYSDLGLGGEVDKNKMMFENFYSFGQIAAASTPENLIEEQLDIMAKLIHYDYNGVKEIDRKKLYREWLELSQHKKISNKAQALHIDIKLLSLGLKKVSSMRPSDELLIYNQDMLNKKLGKHIDTKELLETYKSEDFPIDFIDPIDRLARAEHNRWNTLHYLHGWEYNEIKNEKAKEHDCLLPLEEFHTNSSKSTYKYDLLSVLNIPRYLAQGKYELVEEKTHK